MFQMKHQVSACVLAVASAVTWGSFTAHADRKDDRKDPDDRQEHRAKKVFVVAMENHNWTQPSDGDIAAADLHESPRRPSSTVSSTARLESATRWHMPTNYLNAGVGVHPSEPNYIWAEAGTNFGVFNDNPAVPLVGLLAGQRPDHGSAPERVFDESRENVAVVSRGHGCGPDDQSSAAEKFVDRSTLQPERQFHRARRSTDTTIRRSTTTRPNTTRWCFSPTRMEAATRRPRTRCARSTRRCNNLRSTCRTTNWPTTFGLPRTSSTTCTRAHQRLWWGAGSPQQRRPCRHRARRQLRGADRALIMASKAYKKHGVIVLWWDESERGDTAAFTLPFIVISKDAHENVNGTPVRERD